MAHMYDLGECELIDFKPCSATVPDESSESGKPRVRFVPAAQVCLRPHRETQELWFVVKDPETLQRFRERWITWLNVDDVAKTFPIVYLGVVM